MRDALARCVAGVFGPLATRACVGVVELAGDRAERIGLGAELCCGRPLVLAARRLPEALSVAGDAGLVHLDAPEPLGGVERGGTGAGSQK